MYIWYIWILVYSRNKISKEYSPVGSDINSSIDNAQRLTRFSVGTSTLKSYHVINIIQIESNGVVWRYDVHNDCTRNFNYVWNTNRGLFNCQNVWSSVTHGLEGWGCTNIGSYSTYVSKYDFKFSIAAETFILVRVKLFLKRATYSIQRERKGITI